MENGQEVKDNDDIEVCLQDADNYKIQGTDFFKLAQWEQALGCYQSGLNRLPIKTQLPSPESADPANTEIPESLETPDVSRANLESRCSRMRAILNGNISACYVKLEQHAEVVKACTAALDDDPLYIKVLHRRAQSSEALNTWASLTEARKDVEQLLALLVPQDPLYKATKRKLDELGPRVEAAQKAETTEMLGKLKELGNNLLGNFGLSTDNFKFEPNGSGGYSMNFVK